MQTAAASQLYLRNSYLSDNGYGLRVVSSGERSKTALDSSVLYNNTAANISVDGSTSSVALTDNTLFAGSIVATNSASVLSCSNNRVASGTITETLPLE